MNPVGGGRRLWLIGGTSESAQIAAELAIRDISCTVTVTTEAARNLYPDSETLRVWVGNLTTDNLPNFLQQEPIGAIVDASHPFAAEISRLAIAAAQSFHLPYLRFERPDALPLPPHGPSAENWVRPFPNLEALLAGDWLSDQRVLLTVGSRWLAAFRPWQTRAELYARILPTPAALEAALSAGFTPDRLIALRPPMSEALEKALWQQWQVTCVVTKASGAPGGELIKHRVSSQLHVPLLIVGRPAVDYPNSTASLQDVLAFCQNWWV